MICVALPTVKQGDVGDPGQGDMLMSLVPTNTFVAPVKPDPVMTTALPPTGDPAPGETPVTVGSTAYVY